MHAVARAVRWAVCFVLDHDYHEVPDRGSPEAAMRRAAGKASVELIVCGRCGRTWRLPRVVTRGR